MQTGWQHKHAKVNTLPQERLNTSDRRRVRPGKMGNVLWNGIELTKEHPIQICSHISAWFGFKVRCPSQRKILSYPSAPLAVGLRLYAGFSDMTQQKCSESPIGATTCFVKEGSFVSYGARESKSSRDKSTEVERLWRNCTSGSLGVDTSFGL